MPRYLKYQDILEIKLDNKAVLQKKIEHGDAQMDKDASIGILNDSTQVQSFDGKTNSSRLYDVSPASIHKSEEASTVKASRDQGTLVLPRKNSEKNDEDAARNRELSNIVKYEKMNDHDLEDHSHYSAAIRMPVQVDTGVHTKNISSEQGMLPQRIFHSERIHREQPTISCSSKSDDSSGQQHRLTHSRSDVSQRTTESDKLTDQNVMANLEKVRAFVESRCMDLPDTEVKLKQSQKLKDGSDEVDMVTSSIHKVDLNAAVTSSAVTSGLGLPLAEQGASGESPLIREIHHNKMNEKASEGKSNPMAREEIPPTTAPQYTCNIGAGTPGYADILINVNDRFPHEVLSDIFSKAVTIEDHAEVPVLRGDVTDMNAYTVNNEPNHKPFLQKLAQDDSRKDISISLMDQDHLTCLSSQAKIRDSPNNYVHSAFEAVAVAVDHVDSSCNLGADVPMQSSDLKTSNAMGLCLEEIPQAAGIPGQQCGPPTNYRTEGSDYEDSKKATQASAFCTQNFTV